MKTFLIRSILAAAAFTGLAGTANALPDLIIDNVQYDKPHYSAGDTVNFTAYVWNDGDSTDADKINSPIRVSISAGLDPVAVEEHPVNITLPLETAESGGQFVNFTFDIPADWEPGIYPVTLYIDPPEYGNIWEGLEGEQNNTFSGLFLRVDYDPQDKPEAEFVDPDSPSQAFPVVDGCYESSIPALVGQPYQVRVRATDTDGYIRSVEFFADGLRLGEPDRAAPYEASWLPEGVGVFEISAFVTDNHGNQGYSCLSVTVTEDEPEIPSVTLLSPPDGGSYLPGTVLNLLAAPSDPDGIVQSVQFLVNGVPFGDPVAAPYQGSFVIPSQGTFNLTAIATDNEGNRSRPSNVRTVLGGAPDPEIPLVIIESPLPQGAGDTVNDASVGSSMFLSARVVPPQVSGATVDEVVFYINGVAVGTDEEQYNGIYSLMYQAASTGSYSIYAEAVATVPNAGETRGLSAPILLNVVNLESPYPSVSIEAVPDNDPATAGVQVVTGNPVNIRVTTNAGLWTVDRVDLFVNEVRVEQRVSEGLEGSETFDFTFTPDAAGVYDLRAQVVQIDAGSGDADNWVLTESIPVIANDATGAIPQVSVTSPPDGSSFTSASTIPVEAVVASPESPVETVIFYAGGQEIGRDDSSPYQVAWAPGRAGSYRLSAIAITEEGSLGASAPVTTTITLATSQPPSVSLFSPRDGNSFLTSTALLLYADARDPDGLVQEVEFFVNGVSVGVATQAPFNVTWVIPSSGDYRVTAVALDNTGNRTSSQPISITGAAPNTDIPMVNISHPLALGGGDTVNDVSVGSDMYLNATVNYKGSGTIEAVRFYINGTLVGESTGSLENIYSLYYQPNSVGNYIISAEAEDSEGNVGQAEPVMLNVVPLQSPLPSIALDSFPATTELGDWVLLTATTNSGLLGVDRVDYFANGVLIGSSAVEPNDTGVQSFDFIWYPTRIDTYELSARTVQIDAGGNAADNWVLSNTTSVVVEIPGSSGDMTVEITRPANGESLNVSEPISLVADAVNPGGIISRVEFYLNGQRIPVDGDPESESFADYSYPYVATFVPQSTGTYSFAAKAFDDRGRSVWSKQTVKVNVSGSVVQPTVSLTSPQGGVELTTNSEVTVTASAYARSPGAVINSVRFYANDTLIAQDTDGAPYSIVFQPSEAGAVTFTAVAVDSNGTTERSSAVTVTVVEDLPPTITRFANDASGNALVNVPITFEIQASDDRLLQSVKLYVNGQEIASEGIPQSIAYTPGAPGVYNFQARAVDSAGQTTSSDVVSLTVWRGDSPIVEITRPDADVSAGQGIEIQLDASAQDPDGTIAQVQFRINNIAMGEALLAPPYSTVFMTASPGTYEITAAATDNSGNVTISAPRLINVLEGSVPSIVSFTNDTVNNRSLVNVPITFTVDATDEKGITSATLYQDDQPVGSASSAPFEIVVTPDSADDYLFHAVITNQDGNTVRSDSVLIDVREPNPLANNSDFVFQSFMDIYLRPPTPEEQNEMLRRMETSLPENPTEEQLLNARAAVIVEMLGRSRIGQDRADPQSIDAVRNVLAARHILANDAEMNPWDISREELETQVDVVRNIGFNSLLRDHYLSTYATIYGEALPGPGASDLELDIFIRSLWHAKYGILPEDEAKQPHKLPYPTQSQLATARTMLRLMGLENFLSDFVRDYGLLYSGTGSFTPLLGFQDVPNDRTPAIADAANMILNLLRPEEPVSEEEVMQLASVPQLIDQAKQVLGDPRYADRFLTPVSEAIVTGKDWKMLPWFGDGHFYDGFSPWLYHVNYGWIYVPLEHQRGNGFWLWEAGKGWIFTGSDYYPLIYTSDNSRWIMHDLPSNWYWDYQESQWHKY